MNNLKELIEKNEAPVWMTEEGYNILKDSYLLPNETPKGMWTRVTNSSAAFLKKPELAPRFFDILWKNWLGLASPVAANAGTDRGLPISCFGTYVPDSIVGIMDNAAELAMMTKNAGGVSTNWIDVRSRGSTISGNGKSEGIIPFIKIQDSVTIGVSQGGVRRGASAAYTSIEHGDFWEFIKIRRPDGDVNRQCLNIHHALSIPDSFIEKLKNGDKEAQEKWIAVMKTRFETGEPYLFFSGNVERNRPECYKHNNLDVLSSNICTEILLHASKDYSFVCCLSSLNLARWDEWKATDTVQLAIWFLDGILEEFITKAKNIPWLSRAVASAVAGRAIGLGVMGFHSYLQEHMMPIDHYDTFSLNAKMFSRIRNEAERATKALAEEYGEPEWCKGFGRRNTHLLAVAPTVSNSTISGNISAGVEPWAANIFVQKSAKGSFIQINKELEKILEKNNKNNQEIWKSILTNEGSVQHLNFLTKEEKEVFLTARELNQFSLVKLAGQRQKWIDQSQSINLFFPANVDPNYVHEVHMAAYELGLNTLYYLRTSSVLKGDSGSREYKREITDCKACEG